MFLQVSATFSEQRKFPGSEAELQISAAPRSLCALSAVDKSASFLTKPGSKVDMDRVFQDLARFPVDTNSAPLQSDPWEYCAKSELINKMSCHKGVKIPYEKPYS
jgi:hypothetical protein